MRAQIDQQRNEEFAKQPLWKRMISDVPAGITDAILGEDPGHASLTGTSGPRKFMNAATQTALTALPVLGVTKYLGKGRIPNVGARKEATEQFLDKMSAMGSKEAEAGQFFAKRYPRVAAHMDPQTMSEANQTARGLAHTGQAFVKDEAKVPVSIKSNMNIRDMHNTVAHEGTHVAQVLGMGPNDFNNMYAKANKVAGYKDNPFELSARSAGDKNEYRAEWNPTNKFMKVNFSNEPTRSNFARLISELPPGNPDRMEMASTVIRRRGIKK